MKLKHRLGMSPIGVKNSLEIFYNDRWLSLYELAKLPEMKENGITRTLLYQRWYRLGHRTSEKLFKPKGKYNSKIVNDSWVYEGCTPKQIAALEIGTNKALLEA